MPGPLIPKKGSCQGYRTSLIRLKGSTFQLALIFTDPARPQPANGAALPADEIYFGGFSRAIHHHQAILFHHFQEKRRWVRR